MLLRDMEPASTFAQTRPPLPVRILNKAGGALHKLGINSDAFKASHLIDVAKRRSGLDDFGGGEFFEPLSRLLEACHREGRLNVIGRMALKSDVLGNLTNRLLMHRDRKDNPQIAQQEIRQPLFIMGLP